MTKQLQPTRRNLLKAVGVGAVGFHSADLVSRAVQPAAAGTSTSNETSIIEDFEDGDLSEYTFDYGSSVTSVISSPVYNGSYAMEIDGGDAKLIRTGLSNAPSQGETFSCRARVPSGDPFALFNYGVQDLDNFYCVRLRFDTDKISVLRLENGSWTELTGSYLNFLLR